MKYSKKVILLFFTLIVIAAVTVLANYFHAIDGDTSRKRFTNNLANSISNVVLRNTKILESTNNSFRIIYEFVDNTSLKIELYRYGSNKDVKSEIEKSKVNIVNSDSRFSNVFLESKLDADGFVVCRIAKSNNICSLADMTFAFNENYQIWISLSQNLSFESVIYIYNKIYTEMSVGNFEL